MSVEGRADLADALAPSNRHRRYARGHLELCSQLATQLGPNDPDLAVSFSSSGIRAYAP